MPFRHFNLAQGFDAKDAIHVTLTAILAWLGVLLILPFDTFGGSRAWNLFAQIMTENDWGLVLISCAAVGAVGIDPRLFIIRTVSVAVIATAHMALGTLFFLSNPTGGASGVYLLLGILGYYLCFRYTLWWHGT